MHPSTSSERRALSILFSIYNYMSFRTVCMVSGMSYTGLILLGFGEFEVLDRDVAPLVAVATLQRVTRPLGAAAAAAG